MNMEDNAKSCKGQFALNFWETLSIQALSDLKIWFNPKVVSFPRYCMIPIGLVLTHKYKYNNY